MLQPSIDFLVIFGIAGLESDFLLISDHLLLKANCPAARKENERKIAAGKINAINKRDLPSARQFLFLLSISLVPGGISFWNQGLNNKFLGVNLLSP